MNGKINDLLKISENYFFNQNQTLAIHCAFLAQGHVLMEDYPGMGKTTLVKVMAKLYGQELSRIQMTNDLLASDIIGAATFDPLSQNLQFKKGPLFAKLLLVDELNRASPKTQSALLEAMEERQVSVEGEVYPLSDDFMVLATQNPGQQTGTYPLPESQLDRFFIAVSLGMPAASLERQMIRDALNDNKVQQELDRLQVDSQALRQWREQVLEIHASEKIVDYILAILNYIRQNKELFSPLSPRAGRDLLKAAKAHAFLQQRDHVLPIDIQTLAPAVLSHRLMGAYTNLLQAQSEVRQMLSQVAVLS